jgi:superfamily II DNA or RNA helicase
MKSGSKLQVGQIVWIGEDRSLARVVQFKNSHQVVVEFLPLRERRVYSLKSSVVFPVEFFEGQEILFQGQKDYLVLDKVTSQNSGVIFETRVGTFTEFDVANIRKTLSLGELVQQKLWSPAKFFFMRYRILGYMNLRQTHPMRGLVGHSIEMLAHQLFVARDFLDNKRTHALLCDEVGLGKTVEACMILSALWERKMISTAMIVVPEALKVQWLTELLKKFNIKARLDHEEILDPEDHRDIVITTVDKIADLAEPLDLLIVDEAHRWLQFPKNVLDKASQVLLMTATPHAHGESSIDKLCQMLPQNSLVAVYQTTRKSLGMPNQRDLEGFYVESKEKETLEFVKKWIADPLRKKLFLICSSEADAKNWHRTFTEKLGTRFALFHESMDLVERDRQAAYFANPKGAQFLVTSEIGGEGRNFQFCSDACFLDLPSDAQIVEQRIGRLDRIGQKNRVRVWVPISKEDESTFEKLRDEDRVFFEPFSGAKVIAKNESLKKSQKKNWKKINMDSEKAENLLKEALEYSKVGVSEDLQSVCEAFGIDVEDYDSQGSIKLSAGSLMYVDSFPGFEHQDQHCVTFDRSWGLSRWDLQYWNIDHSIVAEIFEKFLRSVHGRIVLGGAPLHVIRSDQGQYQVVNYETRRELSSTQLIDLEIHSTTTPFTRAQVTDLNLEWKDFKDSLALMVSAKA